MDTVSTAWNKATQMYRKTQEEIDTIDNSRPTAQLERELIWQRTCAAYLGRQDEVEELTRQLTKNAKL